MHDILNEILAGLDLNGELGITNHRQRGFYRLRVALLLVGLVVLDLPLTAVWSSIEVANHPLIRAVATVIQTGLTGLAAVGICAGATACICGIYEVAASRAWHTLPKIVRWLILLAGIPLVIFGPFALASVFSHP